MAVLPHSVAYLAIFVLVRNECNSVFNLLLNLQTPQQHLFLYENKSTQRDWVT